MAQFERVARVFKLMMGRAAAIESSPAVPRGTLEIREEK